MGNTLPFLCRVSLLAVHPHACGEYARDGGIQPGRDRFTPTRVGNTDAGLPPTYNAPVHPHACGEYGAVCSQFAFQVGSPPRVWGIPLRGVVIQKRFRFTPTRVGNTIPLASIPLPITVHPHACREYNPSNLRLLLPHGSPPRVWGIRTHRTRQPAARTVHPHACGEYDAIASTHGNNSGSPPRVWGIPQGVGGAMMFSRFTPTRVGNTRSGLKKPLTWTGSPPRVWGIRSPSLFRNRNERFTPTRVGNTRTCEITPLPHSVHPHACGEYDLSIGQASATGGSPPRVWGIRSWNVSQGSEWSVHPHACGEYDAQRINILNQFRFTPTRVGNTPLSMAASGSLAVHPHACGEYAQAVVSFPIPSGSPPRVWGIRRARSIRHVPRRFTPTRVGNTLTCACPRRASAVHPHACGEYEPLASVTV